MINWKEIKNYENYLVSNTGKIRSKERYTTNNGGLQLRKGRLLKQEITKHGYNRVMLYSDGKPSRFSVHRLVATAFISNPENKPEINHINGIKTDNRVENLEWCTKQENTNHAFNTGLRTQTKSITLIKDGVLKHFDSHLEASNFLGCSTQGISKVQTGTRQSIYGWKKYVE